MPEPDTGSTPEVIRPRLVLRNPLQRWQPDIGSEALELVHSLSLPPESRERLLDESASILGMCPPPGVAEGSDTGLVIGLIQSGKTLSFTSVAALARDNRYPLVIVIAG